MALVVALVPLGVSTVASADSGAESSFLSAINSARANAGLAPLQMDGSLRAHARAHTADMIAAGDYFHSTNGELQSAAGSGWTKLGENVGRGGSVSSLHNAFMNSSSHRANILGDYNYVGIGADWSDTGVLYVTVVFMKKGSTPQATTTTTTAPVQTTTTAKATTTTAKASTSANTPAATTTTTTPPATTTTTTLDVGPDKPVTPGQSCYTATRFGWTCHD